MQHRSWLKSSLALPLFLLSPLQAAADIHKYDKDSGLFSYVTHPEIKAPRWKVNITEPDLVTPGYWFVAPFERIDQPEPGNGWIGPHIYDGNGELVWSGVSMTENWDTIDFKMSNVRGKDMMTFLVQRTGNGLIVDNSFQLRETVDVGTLGVDFNSHEFNFIEDGTKAIVLSEGRRNATKEQALGVKYEEGECVAMFDGFKVLDTKTWKPLFEWSSFDHVALNESTFLDGPIKDLCTSPWAWDFIHLNSVDRDHNGDFYVSGRHTDTIYKVSKDDGHIMWRLHGHQKDDGEWDAKGLSFSRQHNVRFRGFNGTHEIISILDNAHGQDKQHATHDFSRGLTIALKTDVEPKTAGIVQAIDHPLGHGNYAPRRGNYQLLPNGHVFMGWSEQATQSEHTEDGKLVMQATLATEWLGTYRSYKFPFVGQPAHPPRAASAAYMSEYRNTTSTVVHVSWNGATEIASWNLYKTTESGSPMIKIFSKEKTGFETAMVWEGFAAYVIVEAVDKSGNVVGRSNIAKTLEPPEDAMSAAVAEELFWLQEISGENDGWRGKDVYVPIPAERSFSVSLLIFFFGVVCSVAAFIVVWRLRAKGYLRGVKTQRYQALADEEKLGDEEVAERPYPQRHSSRGFRDSS
ncbi:hypothetical protein M409DRAFT_58898 [Zasmidium cellare ATCC 36951]|uniref:ASST-domain-containing protein n=1 Tax=Zasmidium cellare ATCC 36951 TaxID=1080233 RepID=A0A6A6C7W2_ZASCE|nr:uncharacterized protein M409DRAFT_58898 [Zasmidium cellare ATCC 36951]KAF2161829.1 hypothetical protein M409DRAFT_58898 [Zasmidium cellare ATCC 36951]